MGNFMDNVSMDNNEPFPMIMILSVVIIIAVIIRCVRLTKQNSNIPNLGS